MEQGLRFGISSLPYSRALPKLCYPGKNSKVSEPSHNTSLFLTLTIILTLKSMLDHHCQSDRAVTCGQEDTRNRVSSMDTVQWGVHSTGSFLTLSCPGSQEVNTLPSAPLQTWWVQFSNYTRSFVPLSGWRQITSFWFWTSSHLCAQGDPYWDLWKHRVKPGTWTEIAGLFCVWEAGF